MPTRFPHSLLRPCWLLRAVMPGHCADGENEGCKHSRQGHSRQGWVQSCLAAYHEATASGRDENKKEVMSSSRLQQKKKENVLKKKKGSLRPTTTLLINFNKNIILSLKIFS